MSNLGIFKKLIQNDSKEFFFKKIKKYGLHLSIITYLMAESHPAFAFAQVFTGKLGELRNGLILIGKACVGVALVAALLKFLTNQGGNWKWIDSTCAVGCALLGINVLIQFMGGS